MFFIFLGQKINSLEGFLKEGEKCDWENIEEVVTASALCKEEDPIDKAFTVHYESCKRTLNFSLSLFSFL